MLYIALTSVGFGALVQPEDPFHDAATACRDALNQSTHGTAFYKCVVDALLELQDAAMRANVEPRFPVAPHLYDPLRVDPSARRHPAAHRAVALKDRLRDFSCDTPGGSEPVRLSSWSYAESHNLCDTDISFDYHAGFLPAGGDLDLGASSLTEEEGTRLCAADERCRGLTFAGARDDPSARHDIIFKSSRNGAILSEGWHSLTRRSPCAGSVFASNLTVRVLREEAPTVPAVYLVDGFAQDAECDEMMAETIPQMAPSVVSGGGTSRARRSYSVNMYPDYADKASTHTRIAQRMLAFAREWGGYTSLELPGQEPINAVYYKDEGDEYKSHCDGGCNGERFTTGRRVATSLLYCEGAERGGYTLFTRSGLKVAGRRGQLLFFGYKLKQNVSEHSLMDSGHTDHTGCPLRAGRKWIATMWFREGVSEEWSWDKVRSV